METRVLCIGAVLWDVVGRSSLTMKKGHDVPGKITRLPGGVAMNIAMALRQFRLAPELLGYVGRDIDGDELLAACTRLQVGTSYVHVGELPTDQYMAVEDPEGLVAAIADAHSLERAGADILAPLQDGRLSSDTAPYHGTVAIDGNLTEALLAEIAGLPALSQADLRVAPASPGKVRRLQVLLTHPRTTVYLNRFEAEIILGDVSLPTSRAAVEALAAVGANRVVVTDGGEEGSALAGGEIFTARPPAVEIARVTGAGDTCLAAHIAAELSGKPPQVALEQALTSAARYVSGQDPC